MSGRTSPCPPRIPVSGARIAEGRTRAGSPLSVRRAAQRRTPVPLPPAWPGEMSLAAGWPLRDFIELGALPGAVPSARYHCRQVLWEWQLTGLAGIAELLVSELVTNAVAASRAAGSPAVRLWLLSDAERVLILVQDESPHQPVRAPSRTPMPSPAVACSSWNPSAAGGTGTSRARAGPGR